MEALIQRLVTPRGVRSCGLVLLAGISLNLGCSTKAVGISECRDVEYARCEASVTCGVIKEDEVDECKRFYRDHCLHGIAGEEVHTAEDHQACLELIEEAGAEAEDTLGMGGASDAHEAACEIVAKPWESPECSYLTATSSSMGGGE